MTNYQVSVFYNRNKWHQLISNCLLPHLETVKSKKIINSYYCHFAQDQGEHLRLSVQSELTEADLKLKVLDNIQKFVKLYPSKTKKVTNHHYIFCDFDNNLVMSGLFNPYKFDKELPGPQDIHAIRQEISLQMFQQLANDVIDDDAIFSFALYMQIANTLAVFGTDKDAIYEIKQALTYLNFSLPLKDQVDLECQANNIIFENCDDLSILFEQLQVFRKHEWLMNWYNLCEKVTTEQTNKQLIYIDISTILFEHLGKSNRKFSGLLLNIIYRLFVNSRQDIALAV